MDNSDEQRGFIGLDKTLSLDMAHFFLGEIINWGETRTVFSNPHDPKTVIKWERTASSNNLLEFEWWNEIKEYKELRKWFAPALRISGCGKFLVIGKTDIVLNWPTRLPKFMHDIKQENYGTYKDQFVCHDYANLCMVDGLKKRSKMKRVKWK